MTKQPFVAAIQVLGGEADKDDAWGNPKQALEFRNAIRVLEAAGVMGRKRLEELVDITRQQDDTTLEYLFRALLAALPSATPEKKGELK